MRATFKRYVLSLAALMTLSSAALVAVPAATTFAQANAKDEVCDSIGGTKDGGDCKTGGVQIQKVIQLVINLLSIIAGIAAVIMLIIGGFKYITSSGDSNNIASAKNTIIYAIVGLIIAAMAQVIARFVLSSV